MLSKPQLGRKPECEVYRAGRKTFAFLISRWNVAPAEDPEELTLSPES